MWGREGEEDFLGCLVARALRPGTINTTHKNKSENWFLQIKISCHVKNNIEKIKWQNYQMRENIYKPPVW